MWQEDMKQFLSDNKPIMQQSLNEDSSGLESFLEEPGLSLNLSKLEPRWWCLQSQLH